MLSVVVVLRNADGEEHSKSSPGAAGSVGELHKRGLRASEPPVGCPSPACLLDGPFLCRAAESFLRVPPAEEISARGTGRNEFCALLSKRQASLYDVGSLAPARRGCWRLQRLLGGREGSGREKKKPAKLVGRVVWVPSRLLACLWSAGRAGSPGCVACRSWLRWYGCTGVRSITDTRA